MTRYSMEPRTRKFVKVYGFSVIYKWIDKVIYIIRVRDRMAVIELVVQGIIISVLLVYAPQCGLDYSMNNDFYDSFINFVRKLGEKGIVVIAGDFNGHIKVGMKNSMRVMAMEFGTRKRKGLLHFGQL